MIINKLKNKFPHTFLALIEYILKNDLETVKFLITKGADVNLEDYYDEQTPLMHAAENNLVDIIELLIKENADISKVTRVIKN